MDLVEIEKVFMGLVGIEKVLLDLLLKDRRFGRFVKNVKFEKREVLRRVLLASIKFAEASFNIVGLPVGFGID
jgi:hypothetical protein